MIADDITRVAPKLWTLEVILDEFCTSNSRAVSNNSIRAANMGNERPQSATLTVKRLPIGCYIGKPADEIDVLKTAQPYLLPKRW
jgi:hypothetical protein